MFYTPLKDTRYIRYIREGFQLIHQNSESESSFQQENSKQAGKIIKDRFLSGEDFKTARNGGIF